jgi:transcription antitermination factor NusA-like protein
MLEFTYSIQANDKINSDNFQINNKNDIVLNGIRDTDGNNIDLSSIKSPAKISKSLLDTEFVIGGGNKITHTNGGVFTISSSTVYMPSVSNGFWRGFLILMVKTASFYLISLMETAILLI